MNRGKRSFCIIFTILTIMLAGGSAMFTSSAETVSAATPYNVNKAPDGNWYYYENGSVKRIDTVAQNNNGWWVIRDGKVDFSYTGFAKNQNGWWYCKKGKVQFNVNDVIKGTVNGETAWWHVNNGKVDFNDTLARNSNGWGVIRDGKVDFSYTGFAKNQNGWWYCKKGKIQFDANDVIKGTVNGETAWWHVIDGKVTFDETVAQNSNGWWHIQNGKVNFNSNTVAQNNNGWWVIRNGKVNFNYTGFAENQNGWWYCKGGKIQFGLNDVIKGSVEGENAWWCVKNGKVALTYSGIASNKNGYWVIQKGKVNFGYDGMYANGADTYIVKDGKVTGTHNVHTYDGNGITNCVIKRGYACNYCYKDVTDYDDKYSCHGGYHTHTWYLSPSFYTCKECGRKIHIHSWCWIKPLYNVGTDTIAMGGHYQCSGCGMDITDKDGVIKDIDKWTTEYDFSNSDYAFQMSNFPEKNNVWELQKLDLRINQTSIPVGESASFSVLYTPASTTTNKSLTWKSSNPAVAVVSNGVVTAISPGKTIITATAENGVSSSQEITVTEVSHAVMDFSILVDGKNLTDQNITVTRDQLYSLQIIPQGSNEPQYTAEFKEVGYATFYYDEKEYGGIFSIANYQNGIVNHTIIPGWDGKLNMKFNYRATDISVSITVRDEEGHTIAHNLTVTVK